MKIGILIETKEAEKSWNGLRFANTAKENGHEVRVFLMGEAVEIQRLEDPDYNAREQLEKFGKSGGTIFACGTCLTSRGMESTQLCPLSTMMDFLEVVTWSDKMVTF